MSSTAEKFAKKASRRPAAKQVRLKLVYIDFWSAVKLSFLIAVCLAIVTIVGTFLIYTVLDQTQIFDEADRLFKDVTGGSATLTSFISLPQVMGFTTVVALLDLVVVTALGAIMAVLYNFSVKVTGGILVGFTNN
ncbi:DUF3566 domain-containing protein [Microterricola pindariensis]|uniref:DUF3566 domain-containing protein n=1 Tax=Microterricola pindariensis TaxID=478010 RepID=A0ABX5AZN9_9MICO|nr:DUF3566 domain-containing protein [Microterricola pindariensis]PPL19824.1 hypothetical protein GY24_04200 [Microterricola pindariensis]